MLKKSNFLYMYGQLAVGAKQISAYADVIANIEQLVELGAGVTDGIFLHEKLKPFVALLQVLEALRRPSAESP